MRLENLKYLPKTYWLVIVLFAVFIAQVVAILVEVPFTEVLVLDPAAVVHGQALWGIFTNMFIHWPGGISHIFFNCFALFIFGTALERIIGGKNLLKVFIASGLFASLFYLVTALFILGSTTPVLGASGAIFGVIGAMVALRPHTKVMMLFLPGITFSLWMLAVFFVIIALLWFGVGGGTGIAENAHLGGLILGFVLGRHYKAKEKGDPDFQWRAVYGEPETGGNDPYAWVDEYR